MCGICFWEDDGVQFDDPDYEGGANGPSLRQAQKNFIAFGACEESMIPNVKTPGPEDEKDPDFKLLD